MRDFESACAGGAEDCARAGEESRCGDREVSAGHVGEVGVGLPGAKERKCQTNSGEGFGLWADGAVRAAAGICGGGGSVWRIALRDGRTGSSSGAAESKFGRFGGGVTCSAGNIDGALSSRREGRKRSGD